MPSTTALNSAARLDAALKRDLARGNTGARKSVPSTGKSLTIKRAVRGLLGFVDQVNATTTRVRKQSARLGGAHW